MSDATSAGHPSRAERLRELLAVGAATVMRALPKVIAAVAFGLLIVRAAIFADASWDTLAYHLPFSALRAGLVTPESFVMPEKLQVSYQGFPAAIYYLKGFLWRLTGRPETSQVLNVASLGLLLAYARARLGVALEWLAIGLLAIPLIQIGATTNMTDVPANVGMAILFLSAYRLVTRPAETTELDLAWLLAGSFIASGAKPQSMVVGLLLVAGYVGLFLLLRRRVFENQRAARDKWASIVLLAASVAAASYPAIIDLVRFGNPMYPMSVKIAGHQLPGVFTPENWGDPAYLSHLPQQLRWLLSVLELRAFDFRPIAYTVDQGGVPHGAASARIGGYFAPLVAASALAVIFALRRTKDRERARGGLLFLALTIVISSLPGSNELRYYSFWAISLVVIAISLLQSSAGDAVASGVWLSYRAALLVSFGAVTLLTGANYFNWIGPSYRELAESYPRQRTLQVIGGKASYCYLGDWRPAIFDSPAFASPDHVVIIDATGKLCGSK